jgi:hypothetical protein
MQVLNQLEADETSDYDQISARSDLKYARNKIAVCMYLFGIGLLCHLQSKKVDRVATAEE